MTLQRLQGDCQLPVVAELEEQELTLEAAREDLREKLLPYDRAALLAEIAAQQESA